MLKIVLDPPPKIFFFSGIEDFAALGAYIIDYIRVLVPNGVYLRRGISLELLEVGSLFEFDEELCGEGVWV